MIKFKTYRHLDNQVFGCEAFSMLVPEDWNVSGGLIWRQHATMPGAISLSLRSPDGLYEINFIPSMPYYWSNNPFSPINPMEGSYYMGNEVRPPVNHLEYFNRYLLPRSGFNTRVTGDKRFPELENALRQENSGAFGCNVRIDAGLIELEYEHRGVYFQGDMSCGIVVTEMMYGQTSWISDKIISTRAPKGNKVHASSVFSTMLKSFRFNLHWFNLYQHFVQSLTQFVLQDIFNAGHISRIIAENSRQISDIVRSSYERQQASNDRVYRGISESIRGVNSYFDPNKGYPVEFSSDYRYVYTNSLGDYVVTNDASYNPNIGSNLNWTILNRY